MTETSLTDRALQAFGSFYRASLPNEEQVEFGARRLPDGRVSSVASVRVSDMTFIVSASPLDRTLGRDHRLYSAHVADVYLDGAFLTRTSWRLTFEDGWQAWVHVADSLTLELSIVGRCQQPPVEVALVRDRP